MKIQFNVEVTREKCRGWWERCLGLFGKLPFVNRNHLKLKLFVLTLLVLAGLFTGFVVSESYVLSNLTLAWIAQRRAGSERIVYQPEYVPGATGYGHIMVSNSPDLLTKTRMILPYMVYEKLSVHPGHYPRGVIFTHYPGSDSFHVVGRYVPLYNMVTLNERMLHNVRWNDEAFILGILTHELIHAQGGNFLHGMSEEIESATQAGTLEVLAAMCNYSDQVACRGFWNEIEDYGRTAVRINLYDRGLGWLNELIQDNLFRDDFEDRAAAKALRFWKGDPAKLRYILRAYGIRPWEEYIIPGVTKYKELNTGNVQWESQSSSFGNAYYLKPVQQYGVVLGMPFDDTREMLGWLWVFMRSSGMKFVKAPRY